MSLCKVYPLWKSSPEFELWPVRIINRIVRLSHPVNWWRRHYAIKFNNAAANYQPTEFIFRRLLVDFPRFTLVRPALAKTGLLMQNAALILTATFQPRISNYREKNYEQFNRFSGRPACAGNRTA
jgi:hypothetical protein